MLKLSKKEVGSYLTNSYCLTDEKTGETAIIDPGVFDGEYKEFLKELGVTEVKYILLTHGHFDHICGAASLKESFGGEVLIHEEDALCLSSKDMSLATSVGGYEQHPIEPDGLLHEGDTLYLGENKITVMHTPGHTRGSVMFFAGDRIFAGDTLFRVGMGRTDLPGGSTKMLFASLRRIGEIPEDYTVFPGHGEKTTLLHEKRNNRYLRSDEFIRR